nr:ectonucleotide pyrophosphatase/phosphodiesterase [Salinimonas marina]
MLRLFVVVLGLIGITGIFEAAATPATEQHVVLISLDGFRHDYIEQHQASELARIARQGVRAKRLTPVFPANTFPNHLSLITGLLPANHGVVNNEFLDKQRPEDNGYARYHMGKGYKDSSWLQGVPLWTLAELQGKKTASYFWPEADARFFGTTPTYHYHYSKHADYQQRIDQIVSWLQLPAIARPQFVAGYFSLIDTIGHDYGPIALKPFRPYKPWMR